MGGIYQPVKVFLIFTSLALCSNIAIAFNRDRGFLTSQTYFESQDPKVIGSNPTISKKCNANEKGLWLFMIRFLVPVIKSP